MIAGSRATYPREPRQVRKEATVVGLFVCRGGAWLSFFSFINQKQYPDTQMSYLVLARKWRPQFFRDVIGQEHVTSTLQNALSEDRLAHALIFSGPRGVGKTSIARILAKAMNCEKGPGPEPCNECGTCREITSGASVDVQEIDGASNRGIDEIRELRESVRFRPVKSRFKVYVIDEVHMLTKEAFNALLKTLEEPPSHVFFIFATTEPRRIPPTINSRCQHYEFHRLSTDRLAAHLDHIVREEDMGLSSEATLLLAREAGGSVRDSLSLLDQVAAYGARDARQVCEALGLAGQDVLADTACAMLDGDPATCLEIVDRINRLGGDMQKFASDLTLFFRNMAVLLHVQGERGISLSGIEHEAGGELRKRFERFSREAVLQIFDAVLDGQEQVARSPNPKIALELMLMRICAMKQAVSIDRLMEKMESLSVEILSAPSDMCDAPARQVGRDMGEEARHPDTGPDDENRGNAPDRAPVPLPQKRDHAVASHGDIPSGPPSHVEQERREKGDEKPQMESADGFDMSMWKSFTAFLKKKEPLSGSILEKCVISSLASSTITLCCAGKPQFRLLSDRKRLKEIEEAFRDFSNTAFTFKVCYDEQEDMRPDGGVTVAGGDADLKGHPLVLEALDVFNARISGIKPEAKRKKTPG